MILTLSLYVPFIFAFNIDSSTDGLLYFEMTLDTWFILEIILNFFTAYEYKSTFVTNRRKIALNYFRSWFAVDLLSSVPYSFIELGNIDSTNSVTALKSSKLLRIVRFVKYARLLRLARFAKINKII